MLKLIGLDLDDTLIATARYFFQARDEFIALLVARGLPPTKTAAIIDDIHHFEYINNAQNGFNMASQFKSFIEVALKNDAKVDAALIEGIGAIIDRLQHAPHPAFDDTRAFLEQLGKLDVPVVIITAGEYGRQTSKLTAIKDLMGPAWCPKAEFIVPRKTEAEYRTILNNYGIQPDEFLMIGDSMKSDIVPVRKLGGQAVLIERPSETALRWIFNQADFDGTYDRAADLDAALQHIRTRIRDDRGRQPPPFGLLHGAFP